MKENKNFIKGSHKEGFNYKYYRKNVGAVYKIYHDTTGHFYIGRSSDVGRRLSHHFGLLSRNTHKCFRLQSLYNSSLYEKFSFEVIEMPEARERMLLESKLITENQNNPLLLNTSDGNGNWVGERNFNLTDSWKEKLSFSAKQKTGQKNPFFNKKHSNETKQRLSEFRTGSKNVQCYKSVVINGIVYESVTAASQSTGVPMPTIVHRAKSQKPLFVNWYYYEGTSIILNKELIFEPNEKPTGLYFINGTKYFDVKKVMKDFGLKQSTLSFRFNSENFPEWIKIL